MKILKKTRNYYHVRISEHELSLLNLALKQEESARLKEEREQKYADWFFENHEEISWQDEYSSWHSCWKEKKTGKEVKTPDSFFLLKYKPFPKKKS